MSGIRLKERIVQGLAACCKVVIVLLAFGFWLGMLVFGIIGGVAVVCARIISALLRKLVGVLEGVLSGLDGALDELDQYLSEHLGKIGRHVGERPTQSRWNPLPLGLALINFAAVTLQELIHGSGTSSRLLMIGLWVTGAFSVFILLCLLLSVLLSKEKYPYLGSGRLVREITDYGGIAIYIAIVVLMRNLVRTLSDTLAQVEPEGYRFAAYFLFYAGTAWIVFWFLVLIGRRANWVRIVLTVLQGIAGIVFLWRHEFSVAGVYLVAAILTYFSDRLIQKLSERDVDTE